MFTNSGSGAPAATGAFTQPQSTSSVVKLNTHYRHDCQVIDCQVIDEPKNREEAFAQWLDHGAKYLSTCLKNKDYNVNPDLLPNNNGLKKIALLARKAFDEKIDFLDLIAASREATEYFELLNKEYPFSSGKKEYLQTLLQVSKLYVDYFSARKISYQTEILREIDRLKNEIENQIRSRKRKSNLAQKAKEILQSTYPPECKIDYSLLPQEIREYVQYKASFSKAPDIFILSSLLVTLSVSFKNSFYMPKGAYFSNLWPNIWTCCIAISGAFKSSALELGSEIAITIQKEAEEKVKSLRKQLKELGKNEDENKELIAEIKKQIQYYESKMTLIPERITPEQIISRLAIQQGGAFYLEELGAWIEAKSKNYLKDFKGLLVQMYDCRRVDEETRTYGRVTCERPFISLCGVSTLKWLEEAVSSKDIETGFLARFLIFYPYQEKIVPGALPEYNEYDYSVNHQIRNIIDYIQKKTEEKPRKMYVSPEAKDFFEKFHEQLYKLFDLFPEECHHLLEPFIKRWSPAALKLSMIFQPFFDPDSNLISLNAIVAAAELIEHSVKSTIHLLQSTLGESEFQRNCRRILEFIAKRGGQAQRRQIIASKLLPGGTKEYDEVLESLIESGQITLTEAGKKLDWIYSLA